MAYREGLLYVYEKGGKTNGGNGQERGYNYYIFVKMSFWYKCALTSHFVNFCEFEFSVRSTMHLFAHEFPTRALFCAHFLVM